MPVPHHATLYQVAQTDGVTDVIEGISVQHEKVGFAEKKTGMEIDSITVLGEMRPHEGMNGRDAETLMGLSAHAPLDRVIDRFGEHRGHLYFCALGRSEMTSLTPRRPRRVRERRKSVQNGSASLAPIAMPSTSHMPSVLTPTAIMAATETILPAGALQVGRIDSQIRPVPFDRSRNAWTRSSISVHRRETWLLLMPPMPIALTSSSTERVETPWI